MDPSCTHGLADPFLEGTGRGPTIALKDYEEAIRQHREVAAPRHYFAAFDRALRVLNDAGFLNTAAVTAELDHAVAHGWGRWLGTPTRERWDRMSRRHRQALAERAYTYAVNHEWDPPLDHGHAYTCACGRLHDCFSVTGRKHASRALLAVITVEKEIIGAPIGEHYEGHILGFIDELPHGSGNGRAGEYAKVKALCGASGPWSGSYPAPLNAFDGHHNRMCQLCKTTWAEHLERDIVAHAPVGPRKVAR